MLPEASVQGAAIMGYYLVMYPKSSAQSLRGKWNELMEMHKKK